MSLFLNFKKLIKKERPEEGMLVPLLIWSSGSQKNILVAQKINRQFYRGNRKVFIDELTLNNMCNHIVKYPRVSKDDEKTAFYYTDLASYFKWSSRELQKNLSIIDIEGYKEIIARAFGYDNKQRKAIGLGAIKYGKKKRKDTNRNDGRQLRP